MLVAPLLLRGWFEFPHGRFIAVESCGRVGADFDGNRKKRGEFVDERADCIGVNPWLPGVSLQDDLGSGFAQIMGIAGAERLSRVGALRLSLPNDGGGVGRLCRARVDGDRIGDHEAGEHTDAELTEEVTACHPKFVALGGGADRGEQAGGLFFGEANSAVAALEGAPFDGDSDAARTIGVECAAGFDGVEAVLEKFADVDAWAGVQIAREKIDHSSQVHLES